MTSFRYLCTKLAFILFFLSCSSIVIAQAPDNIYANNIKTVRYHNYGDQLSLPVINLNSNDLTELHFDDMEVSVKNYYYTFQLCNEDWKPVNLSQFDYIKGYTQMRINNYRFSSIAYTRYTHYQAVIPDKNCIPTRSGNYLLKIFLDGDT